jgi:hypothetical protein
MNIISVSILLCLTFRNCTILAICSYVIYYNYCYMLFLCFFRSNQIVADTEPVVCEDVNEQLQMEATGNLPELNIVTEDPKHQDFGIQGRRVVDIQYFLTSLKNLKHDGFGCSFFDIEILSETRYGLKSIFVTKCKVCNVSNTVATEADSNVSINKAAVCGSLAVGIGYSQFTELCASLDIPAISPNTFSSHEKSLSGVINQCTHDSIIEAGKQERALAVEAGDLYVDGIPYISVIVDGAWCKRSYKTNYNASSGVACIIGMITKKILYIGIKNKYCQFCEKYLARKMDIPQHTCHKNWDGTSTAMEAQIIVEGFLSSVDMHGLKYKKLVGDGDSSVYNKIKNIKPYGPNFYVEKIECRNHILRNYCNKIKEFAKCTKLSPKIRCLFRHVLRFRTGIISAVKFRKNENKSSGEKISSLKNDILNGPKHIFGCHDQCPSYFCNGPKTKFMDSF